MAEHLETSEPSAAEHLAGMVRYGDDGKRRALALGNRGPMRFNYSKNRLIKAGLGRS